MHSLPFGDSRRLLGANVFFAATGAVLDLVGEAADDALIGGWRERALRAGAHLKWPATRCVVRHHAGGVLLALTAPIDQLLVATEVNEWALCASLVQRDPARCRDLETALEAEALESGDAGSNPAAADPPVLDESAAFARFARLGALESRPALRALLDAATRRGLPHVLDDSTVTLGAGAGARDFALGELPTADTVDWQSLHDIPTAIVTGSNGKTTTVRLLAACARLHGWRTAYNCTDGVYLDDDSLAAGDYSGPAGARLVLREPRAQAAILETARGGILRRGIAVSQTDVAVVTNVSSDHFGEYGIDDLNGLAQVKLSVAAVVKPGGMLILNVDDPQLTAQLDGLVQRFGRCPPLGWFSADPASHALDARRHHDVPTCGPHAGRLRLTRGNIDFDLGEIAALPLSMGGLASYNIANMAGAALAASVLGIAPATIATVLARFGSQITDNPGRLMRFNVNGVTVLVDYAHNPDGLRGFLEVADHLRRGGGRLGILLGQAGNRKDEDMNELVQVAVSFTPDLIVVKENAAQLRGREPGEVSRIMRAELARLKYPRSALAAADDEVIAARTALEWAAPGDVLALPLHSASARAALVALLTNS